LKEVWAELRKEEQRKRIELAQASTRSFFLVIEPPERLSVLTMLFLNDLVLEAEN